MPGRKRKTKRNTSKKTTLGRLNTLHVRVIIPEGRKSIVIPLRKGIKIEPYKLTPWASKFDSIVISNGEDVHIARIKTGIPKYVKPIELKPVGRENISLTSKGTHMIYDQEGRKILELMGGARGSEKYIDVNKAYKIGLGGIPVSDGGYHPEVHIRVFETPITRIASKISKHKAKIKKALAK